MTDSPVHFTKRELQRLVSAPQLWIILAGISLVLGLVGPFGTFETMNVAARTAYWAVIVCATYFTAVASVLLLEAVLRLRADPSSLVYAGLGAISGVPVTLVVYGVNWMVFDQEPARAIAFAPLLAYSILIAAVASGLIAFLSRLFARQSRAPEQRRPALLERLPPARRGRLLYLSVADHYVEVVTDRGAELILQRLGDAILETDPEPGLRIHRSHWIAKAAVAGSRRVRGRLLLKMSNGAELPVSRSHMAAVRRAGLA